MSTDFLRTVANDRAVEVLPFGRRHALDVPKHSCVALVVCRDGIYDIDFIRALPSGKRAYVNLAREPDYRKALRAAWSLSRERGVPLIRMHW